MKKLLSFALAAALCAPAFAQKMGSTNGNAPALAQSITIGDAKMSLDYTSITWADGKTMTAIADKEKGGRARERVNRTAANAPLGKFTTSIDCKCGDVTLPAGTYDVFFTIGDDLAWSLNFKSGDKVMTTKLELKSGEHESKRLQMLLHATDDGAGAWLSFGKMSGMLAFAPAK
jgi:hypothetical protein